MLTEREFGGILKNIEEAEFELVNWDISGILICTMLYGNVNLRRPVRSTALIDACQEP